MTKKKQLDFYESLEERYSDFIRTSSYEDEDKVDKVISTGSVSLDVSLGVGGIPFRRATEIYGAESTGKSTIAMSVAGNAIKDGHKVLYVDAEQAMDYNYGEIIIGSSVYDKDKFLLIQPETMEDSLQICEDGIRSGAFGVVILDSIGSLVAKKVKEETLLDSNPFVLSKKMTLFTQRNAYNIRHFDLAFLAVNQVRDITNNMFLKGDNALMSPGGHTWHHILSIQIQLSRGGLIKNTTETIGLSSRFLIRKNKVAPPYRQFNIPIIFGKGIDYYQDLTDFAIALGIIVRFGAFYKFGDITLGRGVVDTIEYLKSNKDTLDKVIEMCYNIVRTSRIKHLEESGEDEEVYSD